MARTARGPRPRVHGAHRPLAPADRGQRAVRRTAAPAARRGRGAQRELAPFRILTGIEVDILDDGSLDQEPSCSAGSTWSSPSVHSKLRMDARGDDRSGWSRPSPTRTSTSSATAPGGWSAGSRGRPRVGVRRRAGLRGVRASSTPRSRSTAGPSASTRPRLLRLAVEPGCMFTIDTDAHAPGQLDWQPYGCARAEECGVPAERVETPGRRRTCWLDREGRRSGA